VDEEKEKKISGWVEQRGWIRFQGPNHPLQKLSPQTKTNHKVFLGISLNYQNTGYLESFTCVALHKEKFVLNR
jgi:hypothetical protein